MYKQQQERRPTGVMNHPSNAVHIKRGKLMLDEYEVPMRHVYIIRSNWARGLPWDQCSPLFTVTREQVAEIVTIQLPPNWS